MIIGRRRFQAKKKDTGKRLRTNERIRTTPIRLIDDDNEQVGLIETEKAIEMAKERELDLVEVSPNSDPPVCRIMDYGKWKYQQSKKEHQAKTKSKQTETKEVRMRPSTDDNDLRIKLERATEFFGDGHKVQFTILFRGRQNAHKEIGFRIYSEIAEHFADTAHVEMLPRIQGRRMTMLMTPGVKTNAPKIHVPAAKPPPPRDVPLPRGVRAPAPVPTPAPAAAAPAPAAPAPETAKAPEAEAPQSPPEPATESSE